MYDLQKVKDFCSFRLADDQKSFNASCSDIFLDI